MKITFLKSPWGYGSSEGETVGEENFSKAQMQEFIDSGIAVLAKDTEEVETAEVNAEVETATKNPSKKAAKK